MCPPFIVETPSEKCLQQVSINPNAQNKIKNVLNACKGFTTKVIFMVALY